MNNLLFYKFNIVFYGLLFLFILSLLYKKILISIFILKLLLIVIWFFRLPTICIPNHQDIITSPAYGKIESITQCQDGYTCIQIVLNIFNVHAQYIPYQGTIENIKYNKGKFNFVLYNKDYEDNNENALVTVNTKHGPIKIQQWAGYFTRRIVLYKDYKDNENTVKKGDLYGFIKFGSRVDLYVPTSKVEILSKEGDIVKGPYTSMARWKL